VGGLAALMERPDDGWLWWPIKPRIDDAGYPLDITHRLEAELGAVRRYIIVFVVLIACRG
jgi:hypothetical protein